MKCTECEKLIDDYIYNKLDENTTDAFVKHVLGCENCLEELRINYSVMTALDQMDRGDELSEDYDAELNERIVKYVMRKKRRHRAYISLCLLMLIVSVALGVVFSMFFYKDDNIVYGENTEEAGITLIYDGVPEFIDPVENNISEYNEEIIDYIHDVEIQESKFRLYDFGE